MEMTMKTKEVSEQLGVNPTTIQRWMKFFNIHCETNEHGHYFFTDEQLVVLKTIQAQLQEGKKMKEVDLSEYSTLISKSPSTDTKIQKQTKAVNVHAGVYEEKLENVLKRVEDLEAELSKKADEVVSYQLLKHRSEIENMMKMLQKLEARIDKMEEKVTPDEEVELPVAAGAEPKRKWRSFKQMFSF
ncbi:chromosome-anchoring protein RacA [Alkalihalophilus marmarensis]|uniref:chromosome-anchoring protein RacA n=1 Tax=Alkalihalophilus marmarensis TaxID=521377 RepID=UPI0020408529|nr:chromosome-anchoring protein RacA [Alkalihalophilus marmarensis]MCM3488348.1 chromosome-anchoring protein RacA [Alkalihalophilus marmarensis]